MNRLDPSIRAKKFLSTGPRSKAASTQTTAMAAPPTTTTTATTWPISMSEITRSPKTTRG